MQVKPKRMNTNFIRMAIMPYSINKTMCKEVVIKKINIENKSEHIFFKVMKLATKVY